MIPPNLSSSENTQAFLESGQPSTSLNPIPRPANSEQLIHASHLHNLLSRQALHCSANGFFPDPLTLKTVLEAQRDHKQMQSLQES